MRVQDRREAAAVTLRRADGAMPKLVLQDTKIDSVFQAAYGVTVTERHDADRTSDAGGAAGFAHDDLHHACTERPATRATGEDEILPGAARHASLEKLPKRLGHGKFATGVTPARRDA